MTSDWRCRGFTAGQTPEALQECRCPSQRHPQPPRATSCLRAYSQCPHWFVVHIHHPVDTFRGCDIGTWLKERNLIMRMRSHHASFVYTVPNGPLFFRGAHKSQAVQVSYHLGRFLYTSGLLDWSVRRLSKYWHLG